MFEWLTKNAGSLKGVGTLLGGMGQVYGAYSQSKAVDKINKLNLSIYNDNKKRRDAADKSLSLAYENSTYNKG